LLLQFLEHAVSEKFLKAQDRDLLLVREDLTDLLARMAQFRATETRAPGKLQV
jgi:hypothetical protein